MDKRDTIGLVVLRIWPRWGISTCILVWEGGSVSKDIGVPLGSWQEKTTRKGTSAMLRHRFQANSGRGLCSSLRRAKHWELPMGISSSPCPGALGC